MSVRAVCGNWVDLGESARLIRDAVFIQEQGISASLEHDGCDSAYLHCVIFDGERAVATGRMSSEGKIGRIAVLAGERRKGFGKRVMAALEHLAREKGLSTVLVHVQAEAVPFYKTLAYEAFGPSFFEAEMLHLSMSKSLLAT